MPFRIVPCTFPDNLSRNSCIRGNENVTHSAQSEFSGRNGFFGGNFCLEYPSRRSEKVNFHFLNYRLSFRKLQILISQTTDFHFANCRFTFRKLQIFISQTTDFHFVSFHFVSQAKVSLMNTLSETRVSGVTGKEWCVCVCVGKGGGGYLRMHKQGGD